MIFMLHTGFYAILCYMKTKKKDLLWVLVEWESWERSSTKKIFDEMNI